MADGGRVIDKKPVDVRHLQRQTSFLPVTKSVTIDAVRRGEDPLDWRAPQKRGRE